MYKISLFHILKCSFRGLLSKAVVQRLMLVFFSHTDIVAILILDLLYMTSYAASDSSLSLFDEKQKIAWKSMPLYSFAHPQ